MDPARDRSPWTPFAGLYRLMNPRQRRQLFATLALMLVAALAELATLGAVVPFLLSTMGGESATPRPGALALPGLTRMAGASPWAMAALLTGMAVAAAVIQLLLLRSVQNFVLMVGHEVGSMIFHRMLRQPYGYYVQRSTSDILVGVEKVQNVVFGSLLPVMQGATAAVTSILIAGLLCLIQPFAAAFAAVCMAAIYLAVSLATRGRLRRNSVVLARAAVERVQTVREGLGGIRDILLEQSQDVFEERFRELDVRLRNAQRVNQFLIRSPKYVVEATGLALVAVLAVMTSRAPGGIMAAIPVLGAFALGAQRLLPLLQQVYLGWSQFTGNAQTLADVVALTQTPVVTSAPRDLVPIPFSREIRFARVSFRYDERGDTLHAIDLAIPRGARVGILGKSGSGKSTLLDLLMGLLEPTRGEIRIDGRALDDRTRANWQAQIAHVPQAIYLADRSIAANIAFGEPFDRIDIDRVHAAARRAEIADFVEALPHGYRTEVGERGVRMSGGQRQRIGIARALYKNPSLLVLDEATSALDEETEAALLASIARLGRDTTIVHVSHRATILGTCDLLVRLDGGRITGIEAPGGAVST